MSIRTIIGKLLFSWCTVISYSLIVLYLCLQPVKIKIHIHNIDKIVHFCIYFLLAFLIIFTCIRERRRWPYMWALLYNFLFGILIEVLQAFTPVREFEFLDILANLLGTLAGVILALLVIFIGKICKNKGVLI